MFCRHVFGNISGGFRGISRFFGEFRGISRKYQNFAGPRPREISEALIGQRTLIASASKELKDSRRHRFYSGMSLKFQVARLMIQVDWESKNQGFCLVLFFFYFPTKVGGRHVYSSKGTSPAPRPLMTSLLLNILLS